MINQCQVREISTFMNAFLKVFDSYAMKRGWIQSKDDLRSSEPVYVLFKVTGAIDGYLAATINSLNNVAHKTPLPQPCIEDFIELYNRTASNSKQLSAFILEAVDNNLTEEIMYSARKAEPQMTTRIQVNNYSVEFYVLTIKQGDAYGSKQ